MDRNTRIAIEWEITSIVNRFSHYIDKGRYQDLAELFTEDGIFDRLGQVLRGRSAVLDAMAQRHSYVTRHTVTNLVFTRVDADEAEATMYVANYVGAPIGESGFPVSHAMQPALLEFDDVYRRTNDGWKIFRRSARAVIRDLHAH